jgi:two-component system, NarL family, nitrate/nitrite response regulator NarL
MAEMEQLAEHPNAEPSPARPRSPIRVLVADDHPAMRGALARLVEEHSGLELVGAARDGQEAMAMIVSVDPDVALLDVRMPGLDGISLLARLRAIGSPARALLISGNDDSEIAHEAISQGAAGFLSKNCEETEICQAIIAVAEGQSVLSPTLQSGVLDLIRDRAGASVRLSSRELELLELAAAGLTSGAIADRLHLSPNTVKTYWQRVYEKLGAGDRASAIAEAMRRGLLR